jgi:WD40 repeat protein
MLRSPQTSRFVLLASALAGLGLLALALISIAAKPATEAPIALLYQEAPVFLGPHEHSVTSIAFSPDGKTLATGSADGHVRFWEAATGRLMSIRGDDATRGINGVAFSPDGSRIAAVGGLLDKEVVLWDATSDRIARPFAPQAGGYDEVVPWPDSAPFLYKGKPIDFRVRKAVAFSPDGRILATAPGGVVLRDASTGDVIATLNEPAKDVRAIAFSPDGKSLATAAEDKKVRLWSVPAGVLETTYAGATQPLGAVAVSPDGARIVATGSGNRSILDPTPLGYLWSWERSGGPARKIDLGKVHVGQVAFLSPSTVVVGAGRELLAIDLAGDEPMRRRKISSLSEDILSVALSPDRALVACGGKDRTADLIEISTGKLVYRLPGLADRFSAVAASGDGKRFATATIDRRLSMQLPEGVVSFAARNQKFFSGDANADRVHPSEVRIWSAKDGRLQCTLSEPPAQFTAIAFIPHGDQLAMAGWALGKGGMLSLWDSQGGKKLRDLPSRTAEILAIAASPDGRTLASGDVEGNLDFCDLQTGARTRSTKLDHPIESLAFSEDGKLCAAGDSNRTVYLLDALKGTIARTLKCGSAFNSLDFSPDSTLLAVGLRGPGLELWDLRAGGASRTLKAPGDYLDPMPAFVAFSPDGRFVVCRGHGKDIAVFDAVKGTLECELRGHGHPATAAAFLPDGRLVSGGEERTIRIWDPRQHALLATWVTMPADPARNWDDEWVGYTPSGQFVGSANLERLVGWETGGETIFGRTDPDRRRAVENLFETQALVRPATD